MDEAIKNICDAMIKEAEAVKCYTDNMNTTEGFEGAEIAVNAFELNRHDAIENLQNLTIALTRLVSGNTTATDDGGNGDE